MMRAYLSSESGKEFNKNFFMPFSFVGALTALIQNQPSKLTYEALTKCNVYEVSFSDIIDLCKEDINISNLYNRILEHVYIRYEERQLELISMDAKERYLTLRRKIPDIDKLIPQYQIASYLSITPVQLSRIRRKIKKEGKNQDH
jgi:CRP-like cAMP-binding protein